MSKKKNPFEPTEEQEKKILEGEIGAGFLTFNYDGKNIVVIPFTIDENTGNLIGENGGQLHYYVRKWGILNNYIMICNPLGLDPDYQPDIFEREPNVKKR